MVSRWFLALCELIGLNVFLSRAAYSEQIHVAVLQENSAR